MKAHNRMRDLKIYPSGTEVVRLSRQDSLVVLKCGGMEEIKKVEKVKVSVKVEPHAWEALGLMQMIGATRQVSKRGNTAVFIEPTLKTRKTVGISARLESSGQGQVIAGVVAFL